MATPTTHLVVSIDGKRIYDWTTFFDAFQKAFGFPEFVGRSMNAWVDCLTHIDEPEAGMSRVHVERGGLVTIAVCASAGFAVRCPKLYAALVECAAFVNWRRVESGRPAVLALAFDQR